MKVMRYVSVGEFVEPSTSDAMLKAKLFLLSKEAAANSSNLNTVSRPIIPGVIEYWLKMCRGDDDL